MVMASQHLPGARNSPLSRSNTVAILVDSYVKPLPSKYQLMVMKFWCVPHCVSELAQTLGVSLWNYFLKVVNLTRPTDVFTHKIS